MASKNKKNAPAPAPQLNQEQIGLLLQLAQSGDNGQPLMVADSWNAPFLANGFVTTDDKTFPRDAEGRIATMITDAGRKFLAGANVGYTAPASNGAAASTGTDAAATERTFAFADVDLPPMERKKAFGGGSKAIYPFDKLGLKGSGSPSAFFVPATADVKEPWKTLASTVSAANRRFSEELKDANGNPIMESYNVRAKKAKGTPGQPDYEPAVAASKGERPKTRQLRKFQLRYLEDGTPFGEAYKGVKGAVIQRVPVDTPDTGTAAGAAPTAPTAAPAAVAPVAAA